MSWTVTVHWTRTVTDGDGAYRTERPVLECDPPIVFATEREARDTAARIMAHRSGHVDVSVSGPPQRSSGDARLDEHTRTTGLTGLAAARARLSEAS